jgi:hypothetical protein
MYRTISVAGPCLLLLAATGWVSRGARANANAEADLALPSTARAVEGITKTVEAARELLAMLESAGRTRISHAFNREERARWSNLPVGMYPRNGLRWGDLTETQRAGALKLLATALSKSGLEKVMDIMEGDEVLKASEQNRPGGPGGPPPGVQSGGRLGPPPEGPPGGRNGGMSTMRFGRDEYYLALLGSPSLTQPWMIQFGGHHLAINVTVTGKGEGLSPSLTGARPAAYTLAGQTVRPLGQENDKGFALINSLDSAQRKKAILSYQVSDLVLGPGEDDKTVQPEGINASELNPVQQERLLGLAHEWVGILNDEAAAAKMAEVKANLPKTWFAWSGPTSAGSSAYFRIQGPTLFIEYAPQGARDRGGLDGNHIHTIYRDPTNEYGARWTTE